MGWTETVLRIKLRGVELQLEEELKKPPRQQNRLMIGRLKNQIADLEQELKKSK